MSENGLQERVRYHGEQIRDLWSSKASKESVQGIKDELHEVKEGFRNLQISLLVGAVLWALGSAGFLIGVLTLASGGN